MERTAYGKINLGLRVLGKRPDGYHEVDMILQSISLADTITFAPADTFSLETDRPDLPCDDSNLMVKAARAFAQATGCPDLTIFVAVLWTGPDWNVWVLPLAAMCLSASTGAPSGAVAVVSR